MIWVHGACDRKHHSFQEEILELARQAGESFMTHLVYSQPRVADDGYDSIGHVDVEERVLFACCHGRRICQSFGSARKVKGIFQVYRLDTASRAQKYCIPAFVSTRNFMTSLLS
jgi:hypothetical protein